MSEDEETTTVNTGLRCYREFSETIRLAQLTLKLNLENLRSLPKADKFVNYDLVTALSSFLHYHLSGVFYFLRNKSIDESPFVLENIRTKTVFEKEETSDIVEELIDHWLLIVEHLQRDLSRKQINCALLHLSRYGKLLNTNVKGCNFEVWKY